MSDQPKDSFTHHAPMPYTVVLRGTLGDDLPPTESVHKLVAYSVYEALLQAMMEASGSSPESCTYKVVSIGPDIGGYVKLINEVMKA